MSHSLNTDESCKIKQHFKRMKESDKKSRNNLSHGNMILKNCKHSARNNSWKWCNQPIKYYCYHFLRKRSSTFFAGTFKTFVTVSYKNVVAYLLPCKRLVNKPKSIVNLWPFERLLRYWYECAVTINTYARTIWFLLANHWRPLNSTL